MKQVEILNCPFCGERTIQALYFPSIWTAKRSKTATFGSKINPKRSKSELIVRTDCPNCKKTAKEI